MQSFSREFDLSLFRNSETYRGIHILSTMLIPRFECTRSLQSHIADARYLQIKTKFNPGYTKVSLIDYHCLLPAFGG